MASWRAKVAAVATLVVLVATAGCTGSAEPDPQRSQEFCVEFVGGLPSYEGFITLLASGVPEESLPPQQVYLDSLTTEPPDEVAQSVTGFGLPLRAATDAVAAGTADQAVEFDAAGYAEAKSRLLEFCATS